MQNSSCQYRVYGQCAVLELISHARVCTGKRSGPGRAARSGEGGGVCGGGSARCASCPSETRQKLRAKPVRNRGETRQKPGETRQKSGETRQKVRTSP
eukprot:1787665-Rhodomonas_salina.1